MNGIKYNLDTQLCIENLGCGIGFGNSNFWRKWEKEIYTLINPSVVHKTRLLYTHIHKKTQTEQAHAK